MNPQPVNAGSLDGLVDVGATTFSYTGSVVYYVIPQSGLYDIVAYGAQGGSGWQELEGGGPGFPGGYGAEVGGDMWLGAGTQLGIVVGGHGGNGLPAGFGSMGGGGGSFVWETGVTVPVSTPEPSTWVMMTVGFGALGWVGHRKAWGVGLLLTKDRLRRQAA